MQYVKDKNGTPYKKNGGLLAVDAGFTVIAKDEWGPNQPPQDLVSQKEVNAFMGKFLVAIPTINETGPIPVNANRQAILNGANFTYVSEVFIARNNMQFTVVSDTQLIINVPVGFPAGARLVLRAGNGYHKMPQVVGVEAA